MFILVFVDGTMKKRAVLPMALRNLPLPPSRQTIKVSVKMVCDIEEAKLCMCQWELVDLTRAVLLKQVRSVWGSKVDTHKDHQVPLAYVYSLYIT
jgi:hypothetical protein